MFINSEFSMAFNGPNVPRNENCIWEAWNRDSYLQKINLS